MEGCFPFERLPTELPTLTTVAVNPGLCYSELRREVPAFLQIIAVIVERLLAFTTEEGSRQHVYGAVGGSESGEELRGEYINQSVFNEPSDFVISERGKAMQDQVWVGHRH